MIGSRVVLGILLLSMAMSAKDNDAKADFRRVTKVYREARGLSAKGTITIESRSADSENSNKQPFSVLAGKGGRYREEMGRSMRFADGQKIWIYYVANNSYNTYDERSPIPLVFGFGGFDVRAPEQRLIEANVIRQEQVQTVHGSVNCDVIEASYGGAVAASQVTFWIEKESGLVWKTIQSQELQGNTPMTSIRTVQFSEITLDEEIGVDLFKFIIPEGATLERSGGEPQPTQPIGKAAPNFKLPSLDGNPVELAGLKGKIVVLDFWATWCGPCRMEIPKLEKLAKQESDRVVVLGVNVGEDEETVRKFARENKMKYPVLLAKTDDRVFSQYAVKGYPTAVIVDAKGVVSEYHVGARPDSETLMRASIEKLSRPDYVWPQPLAPVVGTAPKVASGGKQLPPFEPKTATEFLARALLFARDRRFDEVVDDVKAALRLHPDWDMAIRLRGQIHYNVKEYEAAIEDYSALLEKFPDWEGIWHMRGLARSYSGHYDLAIGDYTRSLTLNPYSVGSLNSRGWAYLELGDLVHAREDLNRAIELSPNFELVYENRAKLFDKTGDLRAELADLEMAMRLNSNRVWPEEQRARVLARLETEDAKVVKAGKR